MPAPSNCPSCGADIPPKAKACPECGSDEDTGWSDEARVSGLDLPDSDFDYDKFIEKEFHPKRSSPTGLPWFWWCVAILLLGSVVWFCLH